jgi:hypothetical protein
MENRIIELLSEEIREIKNLTQAVKEEVNELRRLALAAEKKAEAAWELITLTREEAKLPFWKKWFR